MDFTYRYCSLPIIKLHYVESFETKWSYSFKPHPWKATPALIKVLDDYTNIQSGAMLKAEKFDENILEEAIVKTSPLRPLPICFYNSEGQSIRLTVNTNQKKNV